MLKNLLITLSAALTLLIATPRTTQAANFVVTTSISTSSNSDCYPVKNGTPIKLSVYVKSYKKGKNTISINTFQSFGTYESWVQITNNSIAVDSSQTITFDLTITPPSGTQDGLYRFSLSFTASASSPFGEHNLIVYVDNSQPEEVTLSLSSKTNLYVDVNWYGSDAWSNSYTNNHSSSGQHGIKSFDISMKNFEGTSTIFSKSYIAPNYFPYTTSISISPNTSYKVFVTATDLAGNSKTSPGLIITTPPSAPSALTSNGVSYCSTTLTWNTSTGATSYNIYNTTTTPSSKIGSSSLNSFTVTGLSAGTTNKFSVTAVSDAGESLLSTTFSVTTLSIPAPTISGPATVCSSGATFTVGNLPSGCSVSWDPGINLSLSSASGSSATFTPTGNSSSWVRATFNAGCGTAYRNYSIVAGSPVPGAISIDFDAPPRRFTATIDGVNTATSYKWYLDGVLKSSTSSTSVIFQRQLNNCGHVYYVDVAEVNACGVSEISHAEVSEDPCYYGFSISPNPASENVTLTIGKAENTAITQSTQDAATFRSKFISTNSYTVRIIDSFGTLKATLKKSGETVTLPVSNLDNGFYIIEINDGNKLYRQQLVVKH